MKSLFLLLAASLLLGTTPLKAGEGERLYYIFDPLCGWCFAFGEEMDKIAAQYGSQMEIRVLSGGMITGERVGPLSESAEYIKEAYETVEEQTGVEFGRPFLDHLYNDGSHIFSSLEPSIALVVMKELAPEHALDFAHDLQKAVYVDGLPPAEFESYASYAENYGVSREEFLDKCRDPDMQHRAEVEFNLAANLGATGFPTILYYNGQELQIINRGYLPANEIANRINAVR